jgi:GTP-binding protein
VKQKHTHSSGTSRTRSEATFSGSAADAGQFPRDGLPEIAFLGRSNVGKSSLLNALAGTRGLARVSSAPGRTRLVNFFRVGAQRPGGRGSFELYLVDLPGYGYAKASRDVRESFERIAVSYLADREPLRLCVFIVDARHEPTDRDLALRDWLEHHGLAWGLVANKVDALSKSEANARIRALEAGLGQTARFVLPVSAEKRTGIGDLWNLIRGAAEGDRFPAEPAAAIRGHDGL